MGDVRENRSFVFTTCRVIEKINFYTLVYYVWDKQSFVRATDKMHSVYYRTYGAHLNASRRAIKYVVYFIARTAAVFENSGTKKSVVANYEG